jgi:hypothetical protein
MSRRTGVADAIRGPVQNARVADLRLVVGGQAGSDDLDRALSEVAPQSGGERGRVSEEPVLAFFDGHLAVLIESVPSIEEEATLAVLVSSHVSVTLRKNAVTYRRPSDFLNASRNTGLP